MMTSRAAALVVLTIVSIVGVSWAPGWAETPVGTNVDTRIVVGVRAPAAEVQRWLPAPWQVNPTTDGPTKDVNLTLTFVDRLQSWDVEGKRAGSGRVVALGVPAKNPQTGESAPFVVRIFDGNPNAKLPGTYKNAVAAT